MGVSVGSVYAAVNMNVCHGYYEWMDGYYTV